MIQHFWLVLTSVFGIESAALSLCVALRPRSDVAMQKVFDTCFSMLALFFTFIWFGLPVDGRLSGLAQIPHLLLGILSLGLGVAGFLHLFSKSTGP